jgi:membrane protein YqaA with SNARE-associated domain
MSPLNSLDGGRDHNNAQDNMNKATSLFLMFLGQLVGFIIGGAAGWILPGYVLWLALGSPSDQGAWVMFLVAPVGLIVGGVVGMILAGRFVKACSQRDAEQEKGDQTIEKHSTRGR